MFQYSADPSIMRKDARQLLRKCDLNTAIDGASAKASLFHALIVFLMSMLASCMANLSKFHVVFLLVRLNKDAFEGHLCQIVNNCLSIFHRTPT